MANRYIDTPTCVDNWAEAGKDADLLREAFVKWINETAGAAESSILWLAFCAGVKAQEVISEREIQELKKQLREKAVVVNDGRLHHQGPVGYLEITGGEVYLEATPLVGAK